MAPWPHGSGVLCAIFFAVGGFRNKDDHMGGRLSDLCHLFTLKEGCSTPHTQYSSLLEASAAKRIMQWGRLMDLHCLSLLERPIGLGCIYGHTRPVAGHGFFFMISSIVHQPIRSSFKGCFIILFCNHAGQYNRLFHKCVLTWAVCSQLRLSSTIHCLSCGTAPFNYENFSNKCFNKCLPSFYLWVVPMLMAVNQIFFNWWGQTSIVVLSTSLLV